MATLSANGSLAPPPEVQEQVNGIMRQEEAKGAVVHRFDPDATPQEKTAVAGRDVDNLKSVLQDGAIEPSRELPVDTGASHIIPTISVEDVDKVAAAEKKPAQQPEPHPSVLPGAMPVSSAPEIPDWYKIGWREVSGIDAPIAEGPAKDKLILDAFLKEQFYGDWYHSAAVIIFAVIATHFLTRFNFGWGWMFIVLAFCATYYRTSIARFRRNARDDIQRELVKTHLMSDSESADWMNHFLDRFWLIYEPVLSRTITATVEQVLTTNCPPFLESMRLTEFTLGSKAPRIDSVKTFPKTEEDIVMMDWDFSFNPNDTSDLTQKQIKKLSNPKIILSIRLGKGLATAAMPILLENMSFAGSMRVRMKLMTNFPHVQVVDLSFMKPPEFDFSLKPIGGETFGFDIAGIPGLSSFIRETVNAALSPMMYHPNAFTLNLEQLLSGQPIDAAIGVLQVTVHSARGLKGSKLGGGTPDPYVSMNINNRTELAKTKYKRSTVNPSWSETKFLLTNSLTETLVLSILDFNEHRKHTDLGTASFNLINLNEDATQEGLEATVLKDGKDRGKLNFDISFYPVLKPEVGQGGLEVVPDTKVGIVRLTVHQAKDLDNSKSMSGELNPFCRVYLGASKIQIHTTRKFKHTNNPVWESSTEFLCSDKSSSLIVLRVIDDRDFLKDPIVGYLSVRLEDLLEARKDAGRDWWPLSGCKSGKLRISAEWKPLNMAGSLHGVDQYVPPIGVVRLWLKKATDVKNVEAALGGKSDPYVRVQINNVTQGRTEVVNNNLNPEWDQIIYIPVHSPKETMMLECMDYQHLTKDRSLGYVELKVSELARPTHSLPVSEGDSPYISTGKRIAEDHIKQDKGNPKGQLHYEAEFIPAILLKDVKFHAGLNELQHGHFGGSGSDDGGTVDSSDASTISSSAMDETNHAVPTTFAPLPDKSRIPKVAVSNDASGIAGPRLPSDTQEVQGGIDPKEAKGDAKPDGNEDSDGASQKSEPGLHISKEDLLKYQSGVIVCNVLRGQLHKKARLEVLLDDGYWPAFSTSRARSYHAEWEHLGEGFVKELDFSRVWLRLNEADEGDKDDIVAEWTGETKSFLERALGEPYTFTLTDKDDPEKKSTVVVEARFVPVPVVLEPRESVNNQGLLRVELLDGKEIHGVDRGGKSDPFAVFELNGQRVFKSQTKKKTLAPEWNETFTVQVPSRVAAKFSLEVFDWNQIEQAKSLGFANIDLASLEPFVSAERDLALTSGKHGDKGTVRVNLVFTPEIIAKSRKGTSTFSTAGRAMTQIGHLPLGAGRGVAHGVTGIFRRDHAKPSAVSELEEAVPPSPTTATAVTDKRSISSLRSKPSLPQIGAGAASQTNNGGPPEPGTLKVTVIDGKELASSDVKPYVVVRVGEKELKTKHVHKTANPAWNETFLFAAGPTQLKLYIWLYDNRTLGKDKMLGLGDVDVWSQLNSASASQVEVAVNLREGHGCLRLRLEFDPDNAPPRPSLSTLSLVGSPASPSRFSLSTMTRRKGLTATGDE